MLRAIPGLDEIGKVVRGNRHLLLCGIKLELNCICQRQIIFHGIAGIVAVEPLFLENIGTSVLVTPNQVIQFLRIIQFNMLQNLFAFGFMLFLRVLYIELQADFVFSSDYLVVP